MTASTAPRHGAVALGRPALSIFSALSHWILTVPWDAGTSISMFPVGKPRLEEVAQSRAAVSGEACLPPEPVFLTPTSGSRSRACIHSFIHSLTHSIVTWYMSGPGPDSDTL